MTEFEIGDYTYRATKLPVMTQLHISRRLAPVIAALAFSTQSAPSGKPVAGVSEVEDGEAPKTVEVHMSDLIEPLAKAMATLSDGDTEYIISNTLAVVQRQRPGDTGFAAVWSAKARAPMFDDITMIDTLLIAAKVIIDQIGPFTSVPSFNFNPLK